MATRHPRSFWKRLVAETERGGTVGSVARRNGVRAGTLTWWRWRLRHEEASSGGAPQLLPVVVESPRPDAGPIEIAVADVRLRVEVGSDVAYVATLVGALRTGC